MPENAVGIVWLLQAILPPLAVAGIVGYIKLANRAVQTSIETVAKDIRKATERIETSIDKMESRLDKHDERLTKVEISQAIREGREQALAEING